MEVLGHADSKYATGARLGGPADWQGLRVEWWRHEPGVLSDLTLNCTEVAVLLAGQLTVKRTGDGQTQKHFGSPGTTWICPAGVFERDIELSNPMVECLHIFLPPLLLEDWALENYGIDPSHTALSYAGGLSDLLINQIAITFRSLLDQENTTADRLLIDGLRTTLAAHLVGTYSRDRWQQQAERQVPNSLSGARLRRVVDFVEAHLAQEISLDDLAAQACLSAFHFARLFRQATGLTPHRYVTERRIQIAKERLAQRTMSLTEIALETGFGSPANFSRAFRKATGCAPSYFQRVCD